MSKNQVRLLAISAAWSLVMLTGCAYLYPSNTAPTQDTTAIYTQAAETIQAQYTQVALFAALTPTETQVPTASQTPEASQATAPAFTETASPVPTLSPTAPVILPSNTPIPPTQIVPSLTAVPVVCDRAQLIRDVSVQDNTPFAPGVTFVKTWQLKNVGNCTWTKNYNLIFMTGNAMGATKKIALPQNVEPGQTINISVTMKSPAELGTYRGDWMLSNASGTRFGIGTQGANTFWTIIRVINFSNQKLIYDFAANYCLAEWASGAGALPCPGASSTADGFVIFLDAPHLENRVENELTLWAHPNNQNNGWISGTYPEFTIQPDQHFIAWVGCLDNSKGCNVDFRLDFKNIKAGNVRNLGSWHEVYDGSVTKIDLDLSEHAGKRVRFMLTVQISGGNSALANAFWFVPGIIQTLPPTATATATAMATATETPTP